LQHFVSAIIRTLWK